MLISKAAYVALNKDVYDTLKTFSFACHCHQRFYL